MDKNLNEKTEIQYNQHRLVDSWNLIEKYQTTSYQSAANYTEDTDTVYSFSSLNEFAQLWKHTSYANPSSLFFDLHRRRIRKIEFNNEGELKTVDALYLFKNDIQPKWEDPANSEGSSLIVELKHIKAEQTDEIWKDIVFSLIGSTFPHCENVNGIRLMDRQKKHELVKFEIWISIGLKKWKSGTSEYELINNKIEDIIAHFHSLFNKTVPTSIHMISTKDHLVANKNK